MKVWDQAGIELGTPGSAGRLVSVARHITVCAALPGTSGLDKILPVSTHKTQAALAIYFIVYNGTMQAECV